MRLAMHLATRLTRPLLLASLLAAPGCQRARPPVQPIVLGEEAAGRTFQTRSLEEEARQAITWLSATEHTRLAALPLLGMACVIQFVLGAACATDDDCGPGALARCADVGLDEHGARCGERGPCEHRGDQRDVHGVSFIARFIGAPSGPAA